MKKEGMNLKGSRESYIKVYASVWMEKRERKTIAIIISKNNK